MNQVGGLTLPTCKIYYQSSAIKIVWYWHKDRQIDKWDGIGSLEIDSYMYEQLISNRNAKEIQWKKGSLFNNWYGTIGDQYAKKKKIYILHYMQKLIQNGS